MAAGLSQYASKLALDTIFTGSSVYVAYATGTFPSATETSVVARHAVPSWVAATLADPSVKNNNAAFASGAASSTVTITSFALFDSATSGAGNQLIDWTQISPSRTLNSGDSMSWAATGSLSITLT